MRKLGIMLFCLMIVSMMVSGCGPGASEDKPIAEVKQESQTMDVNQLKSMVEKYQKAIEAKKPELEKLQAELKKIPITQLMGEDAKGIREDIGQITTSIKNLTDRMKIYMAELNKKQ